MFKNTTVTNNLKYTVIPARDVQTIPRYEISLIVHNVQTNDFGEYECHVINQYGTEFARIRLEKRSMYFFDCLLMIYFRFRQSYSYTNGDLSWFSYTSQWSFIYLIFMLSSSLSSRTKYEMKYSVTKKSSFVQIERTTIRRMRQVQTWLQSKPSMWIHNLAAAEKVGCFFFSLNRLIYSNEILYFSRFH